MTEHALILDSLFVVHWSPRFSPDDQTVAMVLVGETGQYVATLDPAQGVGSLVRLSREYRQVQSPTWSADARTVYFTATTRGESVNDVTASNDLFAIRADGSGLRQITRAATGERFAAAVPYQNRFLVSRARGDGPWTVGWLSTDGSTFTPMKGPDGKPVLGTQAQLQP